ncbi:hypothetical protein BDV93DRAFT_549158 [Ceratobasidium sp. AG-I]|nr:hypothetical protein BDV93DRAFT_549158 [Ceratobasidium sp. AG-I]
MSLDRVHLLSQHETRPLERSMVETAGNNHGYFSQRRSSRHVNFSLYDEVHPLELPPNAVGRLDIWTSGFMCCLLLVGLACGIVHHVFNAYLDGKTTASFDQAWAIRIGTALALGLKTALLASMGMAFTQRLWRSVYQTFMSVKALDSLFGAFAGDPRSLFRRDLYSSARLALLIAVAAWLLPIATIFTPATLRVKASDHTSSSDCIVPTIDLSNITDGGLLRTSNSNGMYAGPAPAIQRFALQSLISGSFSNFPYTSSSFIGTGTSYTINFTAPALRCSVPSNPAPSNSSNPQQSIYWQATRLQMHDSTSGQDVPTIQVQYVSTPGSSALATTTCVPYLTNYGVMVAYNVTAQTISILNMTMTAVASRPVGGVIQVSVPNAVVTGAAAIVDATFNALIGSVTRDQSGALLSPTSHAVLASFAHASSQSTYTFDFVPRNLEQLMNDVSLSTIGLGLNHIQTQCIKVDQVNVYVYEQGILISCYLAAVAIAVAILVVGLHALKQNGHSGDTSFSGVILSTRNPTLDLACEGGRDKLLELRVKFATLRANGRPAFGNVSDFID